MPIEGKALFPGQSAPPPVVIADEEPAVVDDDDAVMVPAPPVEYLGHLHPHQAPAAAARQAAVHDIGYRRTLIPILLTTGLSMIVFGAARYFVDPDSPLGLQGAWFSIVLFAFGAICLAGGVLSMLQLQLILAKQAAPGK